jgi:nucleoside-diphosphate-sugar epimerase
MKRVLVTGASGFLGKPCLPLLVASEYEVHAVTSRPDLDLEIEAAGTVIRHQIDLLNDEAAMDALMAKVQPTHLLHLAWCRTLPGQYWNDADNFRWVQSSLRLFRQFARCGGQRIVAAGTCAEYDWNYGYCSETHTPLRPATVYGTCKHALQLLLKAFAAQTGLGTAWGRLFFLYGPQEYSGRLVASVIGALLRGQPALCSSGEQLRDFLYVEDAAAAFVALLDSEVAGPVNIASGQPVAVKDVVCKIGDLLQRRDLIQLGALPTPVNEPRLIMGDVTRLQAQVGWSARYNLNEGLKKTIGWWEQGL